MKNKNSTENYLIDTEHPLGRGAFATVYAAVNKKNPDKLLAMKRIKLSMLRQRPDLKILLEQEISVMKLLNCNHSVKFYESGEDNEYYDIIIEYCNGKTLNMDKKYSIEEVRTLLLQLNTVFKLMNELRIIHRDLKLENIFLNYPDLSDKSKFEVKLGDFGLSKQLVNTLESRTLAGSPVYMAPEILINKLRKPYTSKVDIWSLGVIIFQLLFQKFPFYGNSMTSLKKDLIKKNGIPQEIEKIEDENLKDLMKKIFVIEPKNRISWSNYFDHPFFKENNEEDYPDKIEFDLGENLKDNKYFNCFVYTDKNTGKKWKKFFVKQYLKNFCEKAKLFKQAFYNANSLKNNKHSLKFKSIKSKKDYCYIEYEFIEGEILTEYLKKNVFDEQELRKKIQDFYYKLINEIDIKKISFSVLTTDSILIDKNKNFILFDFGLLKEILPRDKITEYYICSPDEIDSFNNSNILNFGVILFKCICGNIPISIVEKRIDLPKDKKISNELLNFLSHCINRRNNIRYRWNNFKDDPWINPNRIEHVLNNNNLKIIVKYYEEKFNVFTNYYNTYLASVFSGECIVENFLFVLLNYIEFKMILGIFDEEKNDFSEQEEILFIESNINDTNEYNFASLNLNKYKIFETKEKEKNEERKAILKTFKSNLKKYEINLKHILEYYLKIKEIRDEDFLKMLKKNPFNFINLYLKMFNEINWDNFSYFFDEPKMKKIFYEFLISVKIYISRDHLKNFNNLKEIFDILSSNDNILKISVLDSQNKINFFSCLGGIFRFYQNYSEKHKINISSNFDNYNNYENYLINYLKLSENTAMMANQPPL